MEAKLKERELPDDYPLREGFLYVADGKVVRAIADMTVQDWKKRRDVRVITNCDIGGRNLWHETV